MKKHFVTFYSPGTFFPEKTTKPIDEWDIIKAAKMAKTITERHSAKPFGFRFSTRERKDDEFDSKVTKTSNMYYLGGKIMTLSEIKLQRDPKNNILISNMENNGWDRVIENNNSWRVTRPLEKGDIVLEVDI